MAISIHEILINIEVKADTDRATAEVRRNLRQLESSARQARKTLGQVGARGMKAMNDEVDRQGPSLQRRFLRWFSRPDPGLYRAIARPFASAFSVPVVAVLGAMIVTSLAGPISAGIAAAITGGIALGSLALAGWALRENKRLKVAFANAGDSIGQSLTRAARPLVPVFETAIGQVRNIIVNLEPQFRSLFKAAAPIVPILIQGFGEFANQIMPHLIAAMPQAVRMISMIAVHAPKLADAFGEFLDILARNEPVLARTLDMTLGLAEHVIPALGRAMVIASGYFVIFWTTLKTIAMAGIRVGDVLGTLASGLRRLTTGDIKGAVSSFNSLRDKAGEVGEAVSTGAKEMASAFSHASLATEHGTASMISSWTGVGTAVEKTKDVSITTLDKLNEATAKTQDQLNELRENAEKNSQAMIQSLSSIMPAFEGVQKTSRQTASHLNANLRSEIAEARRWSANLQNLLKRGADPKFVQALSIKGPQFVAAYVRGSDRQLRTGQRLWERRERAMLAATRDAKSLAAASVRDMVNKMNLKLADLKAQVVALQGKFGWEGLKVFYPKGGGRGAFAHGGPVTEGTTATADDVIARLSKGEFIVNAKAAEQFRPLLEAINKHGLPGMARGGAVLPRFRYSNRELNRWASRGADVLLENIELGQKAWMRKMLTSAGGNWGSGSWMRAIGELRADGVPYNIISTFRPGARTHASGAVSYHALNRAVDLTGPNMMAIFNALVDTNPTELIYSHAPMYKSRRGWSPIGQLDPITFMDHLSHVHAAYRRGGLVRSYDRGGSLPPGLSMAWNGTGRSEPVGAGDIHIHVAGNIYGGQAGLDELTSHLVIGLNRKARREGGSVSLPPLRR